MADENPAELVAGWLRRARPAERDLRLRQLLAHAAAGLVLASGPEAAAETVYRLADAIVEKGALPPSRAAPRR